MEHDKLQLKKKKEKRIIFERGQKKREADEGTVVYSCYNINNNMN